VGITGKVKITGTNFAGEVITEEITANGTTAKDGNLAFKTVTQIDLPIQDHTPAKQVETVTVTAGASRDGTIVVRVTAAGLDGGFKDIDVDVTTTENEAAEVAALVRAALGADADIIALYDVGGTGADIVLTDVGYNANDATLAITVTDAPDTGVTIGASENTVAGVLGVAQIETIAVTAGSSGAGTLVFTVTAAGMDNSPKAVNVDVTSDTTAEVATKIRAALEEDADVGAFFTVSGADANIVLTAKTKAANDATMAMELTDADGTGVTVGASTDTQAGVAPVCQVETIATATGATQHGIVVVTVTAANMVGSPISVDVEVDANDSAVDVAGKIRTALGADETIGAFFTISGTGTANIILTCVDDAANDGTMAIAITDAPATSVAFGASANTTAGVPYDQISVGWGDKFGLPYKLYADELVILKLFNKAKEGTEGTVTADVDDLAKNVYDPNNTSLGVDIDLYIIV
jgi:hypothetical protein